MSPQELLAEIADAAMIPSCDPIGNAWLLEEVERQHLEALLDADTKALATKVLQPAMRVRPHHVLMGAGPGWRPEDMSALQDAAGSAFRSHIYHGTRRSRLVTIFREGLVTARKRKRWSQPGIDAHARSGVFFTECWRGATNWVGETRLDRTGRQGGVLIRVPRAGLTIEPDTLASWPGCLVVRQSPVAIGQAEVMLPPFSATQPWIRLSEAAGGSSSRG